MIGLFFLGSRKVKAQVQCVNWTCGKPEWCEGGTEFCPYPGWISTCWCDDNVDCIATPELCPSCPPGSYVCNRDTQCCPYDICGDGICQVTEDCNSCPTDCGVCSGGGGFCGDSSCGDGENCQNCVDDCGTCPAVTADVKADGSDVDITVAAPYTISWSSTDAYGCLLNSAQVDTFGSIGYSHPAGVYPYDLSCIGVDTQDTDSVNVTVDCSILTADVKANGSDTNITTDSDYTISWSSANASSCVLNGASVALSGSQIESAVSNGTYPYDLTCSTSVCSNFDSVNVTVDLCGNGVCSAFENCSLCAADCGTCPTSWWQVAGGNLFAGATSGDAIVSDIASSTTCVEPNCVPGLSIRDRAGTVDSDGFPVTGGGAISVNGGMITYRDPDVSTVGTSATRLYENYSYFYNKYSLGLSPSDDYSASAGDALKPVTAKDAYFHSGDMTIQSPWDVASGESYVIFVDGNLTIEDPLGVGELIKVADGGFLAFIVSGDITIADSVGHSVLSNTAGNIEGVYVADGVITVATNGTADKKFIGEGSFVGWGGVALLRTYAETSGNNSLYPAETFVYRPDFVKNTPTKMKRAQMLWQETN